jgi:heme/copper-type cytochrome/quinol oxidase subunit 3
LIQEYRFQTFLRWSWVLDLRVIRSILEIDESQRFIVLFYSTIRSGFLLLKEIYLMPLRVPKHPFHLVSPSPWPFYTSIAAFVLVLGLVQSFHFISGGFFTTFFGLIYLISVISLWWRDVIREAVFQGMHTLAVQRGLRIGMLLFILSEVMFFSAFFWAFFHASLAPTIEIGAIWPPLGFEPFDPWGIPLLNTFILLLSGLTITYCHDALVRARNAFFLKDGFLATLLLAIFFLSFQLYEYKHASFSISDGVYGSTFYMATGFHGFHVLVGAIFIAVCFYRRDQFTVEHHVGLESAAWYWHFVDVVWLFLFLTIYWWSSLEGGGSFF